MLSKFFEFWSLRDPNVVWVMLGSMLLGGSAGTIGCFAFLRKRSLTGDALAHAALPGVTSAFLIYQSREPAVILLGAVISCLIGYLCIEYLITNTRVKEDSAFAIILSTFFALGIFQLTYIQKLPSASQSGLDKLLFGQAASLVRSDVILLGGIAALLIGFSAVFFNRLKLISFDRPFAQAVGISLPVYEGMLALATVLSTVIGLQLVGVVLMAALLLTPAAAARYWTERMGKMIVIAGIFGSLAGVFGANVSYMAPNMPTGPWMVVGITLIFVVSIIFAPERGMLGRYLRRRQLALKTNEENLLRTIYKIGEGLQERFVWVSSSTILTFRNMRLSDFDAAIDRLMAQEAIEQSDGKYRLTEMGYVRARKITRRHRLWELYLTERIGIASDHVHADAEEIEHILTPELEARLKAELNSPDFDPHGKGIPRSLTDRKPDTRGEDGNDF